MMLRDLTTVKIFKKDIFGKIELARRDKGELVICRKFGDAKLFARPLAFYLAYREKTILDVLGKLNDPRLPRLLHFGKGFLVRSYIEGTALKNKKIADISYYDDAAMLLKKIHTAGIVHNDLEKPENWLVTGDNTPGIIDFQLACYFPKKGKIFKLCQKEDLRHLIKQKKRFSPDNLSEDDKNILKNKTQFAKIWRSHFKKVYNFITRKVLHYSDRDNSQFSR